MCVASSKERVKIWATLFLLTKISRCKRASAGGSSSKVCGDAWSVRPSVSVGRGAPGRNRAAAGRARADPLPHLGV